MSAQPSRIATALRLQLAGRLGEAEAMYREVLRDEPEQAEVMHLLGVIAMQTGRYEEAIHLVSRALAVRGPDAVFHNVLGFAYLASGKLDEAIAHATEAIRLKADLFDAHNTLGVALRRKGDLDAAERAFREAVRFGPTYMDAYENLAALLQRRGAHGEAIALCEQALKQAPESAQAHNALGAALRAAQQPERALVHLREAVRLNPSRAIAERNLGVVLKDLGAYDEAEAALDRAIALDGSDADAHVNRAMLLLARGDFTHGFVEYEWRARHATLAPQRFREPRWTGDALAGRTILLHAEQGLGDTIQFVRYAPMVKAKGGRVVVVCAPRLAGLVRTVHGVDAVVPRGSPLPRFDVQAPLMSLPALFGTTVDTVPANVPYLHVERPGVERDDARVRVGVAWQGSTAHPGDRFRSAPLTAFAPLAEVPNVHLVSVQHGFGVEQIDALATSGILLPITTVDAPADWTDTAAVLRSLDLLITVDTAVAHCAGALGLPVWLALHSAPDWRWIRGRDDTPWYPTMRLFRQPRPGDWESVFSRLAMELRALAVPRMLP